MRLTQRLVVLTLAGLLLSAAWLGLCFWLSRLPAISPVSLSLAFQPWWRYWNVAAVLFFLPFLVLVILILRARLLE